MTDPALRTAVLLLGSYAALIVVLFEIALLRGRRRRRALGAAARVIPEINQTLVAYLAGNNDLERLRQFQKGAPQDLAAEIMTYRGSVAGAARDRLCDLTLQLGLLHGWRDDVRSRDPLRRREAFAALAFVSAYEPCRRVTGVILAEALDDSNRDVRIIAAQALAQFGDPRVIAQVFDMATRETLLGRILLAEQLRPHALELCRKALPEALSAKEPERVLGALEIVVAWERALPLSGIEANLNRPEPLVRDKTVRLIRIAALRAAPLVLSSPELEAAVTQCLSDRDAEIAMAAAAAAARLRIAGALPLLARCLRTGDVPLARTAAGALASLPPQGWKTLQELAASAEPVASGAAIEALCCLRTVGAA